MNTDTIILAAFSAYIRGVFCDCDTVTDEDFIAFVKKSMLHKILPMVSEKLIYDKKLDISEKNMQLLRTASKSCIAAQTIKSYSFIEVYNKLTSAGVVPLCVKGCICRSLYPNPDFRASSDEDLLVSEKDFNPCCDILTSCGYTPDKDTRDAYEIGFTNDGTGDLIELHRSLFSPIDPVFNEYNCALGDMFFEYSSIGMYGTALYCPSPDNHILYLILHALKHFIHAGTGIRQICDIALTAKHYNINWQFIFNKCRSLNADIFLNSILIIANKYFGLQLDGIIKAVPDFNPSLNTDNMLADIMSGAVYGADTIDRQHSGTITLNSVKAQKTGEKQTVFATVFPSAYKLRDKYTYLNNYPALLPVAWMQRLMAFAKSDAHSDEIIKLGEKRKSILAEYGILK